MILILEPDSGSFAVYVFRHACRKNGPTLMLVQQEVRGGCRCLVAPTSNNLSLLYFAIPYINKYHLDVSCAWLTNGQNFNRENNLLKEDRTQECNKNVPLRDVKVTVISHYLARASDINNIDNLETSQSSLLNLFLSTFCCSPFPSLFGVDAVYTNEET
jgi:hypothetical protein